MKPLIRRDFGIIVVEASFNAGWVDAIKQVVPSGKRSWTKPVWGFDPSYYGCVKTITEHFHGGGIIDSTGGVSEPQSNQWREPWEAYKELNRKANEEQKQHSSPQPSSPAAPNAFATLFVTTNAPKEVVTAAYRVLSKIHHPDNGGSEETMARINAAYTELKKKGRV